jgi:hypothetical protein
MSGLRLIIPDMFEIRVLGFARDEKGREAVRLEVRQTIDHSGQVQRATLAKGAILKLHVDHESHA